MRRKQNSHYKGCADPMTEFCLYPKGSGRPLKGPQLCVEQVKRTWSYLHFEEITQAAEWRANWNGTSQSMRKKCPTLFSGFPIYAKIREGPYKIPKAILQIYIRKQVELGLEGRELRRQMVQTCSILGAIPVVHRMQINILSPNSAHHGIYRWFIPASVSHWLCSTVIDFRLPIISVSAFVD